MTRILAEEVLLARAIHICGVVYVGLFPARSCTWCGLADENNMVANFLCDVISYITYVPDYRLRTGSLSFGALLYENSRWKHLAALIEALDFDDATYRFDRSLARVPHVWCLTSMVRGGRDGQHWLILTLTTTVVRELAFHVFLLFVHWFWRLDQGP